MTDLYKACEKGHVAVVERLLAHDAIDVNQGTTDEYGTTPLYMACQKNHEAVVERLLAHDAINVNQAKDDREFVREAAALANGRVNVD